MVFHFLCSLSGVSQALFSSQAAVYALLQAAIDISSRGERRDTDTNIFVQRRLT